MCRPGISSCLVSRRYQHEPKTVSPCLFACLFVHRRLPVLADHPALPISPRPPLRPAAPQIASPHIRRLALTGRDDGKRNGERQSPACFAKSDKLRRYYGDDISRLRSRLHAGILYIYHRYGPLAQSREQRICNSKVAGWNPAWSTKSDTGRLLDSGRPVFRTAHRLASPLPVPRAALRAAGRDAPTARRETAPPNTIRRNPSISSEMIRAAGQIALTICRHSHICPSDEKSAFLYHITTKAASRPTPRICDTGNGERSPPFACRH